jgi:hypothetical protein
MPAIKTQNIQYAVTHFLEFALDSFRVTYQHPQTLFLILVVPQNSHNFTAI